MTDAMIPIEQASRWATLCHATNGLACPAVVWSPAIGRVHGNKEAVRLGMGLAVRAVAQQDEVGGRGSGRGDGTWWRTRHPRQVTLDGPHGRWDVLASPLTDSRDAVVAWLLTAGSDEAARQARCDAGA